MAAIREENTSVCLTVVTETWPHAIGWQVDRPMGGGGLAQGGKHGH